MGCAACEELPRLSQRAGRLLLAPAPGHTFGRLTVATPDGAVDHRVDGRVITLSVPANALGKTLRGLGDCLTAGELKNCRSLFLAEDEAFTEQSLAAMQPLATLVARAENGWLTDLLADGQLTVHFQPIVHAASPTRAFAHEALLRGLASDGTLVAPDRLFDAARACDMLFQLDRAARIKAIREGSRHDLATSLFINFNPTSIYDPRYCLRTTFAEARQTAIAPERLVFEVVESEYIERPDDLIDIMKEYRANGFRVALDDLGAGYSSLNLLQSLRPDFVKIDRELIRTVDRDPVRQAIVRNLVPMAHDIGAEIIAEGVERLGEMQWLQELGVDYLQGFYFARPASPPPTLLMA